MHQRKGIFISKDCDSCCRGFEPHQPPQYSWALATFSVSRAFCFLSVTDWIQTEVQAFVALEFKEIDFCKLDKWIIVVDVYASLAMRILRGGVALPKSWNPRPHRTPTPLNGRLESQLPMHSVLLKSCRSLNGLIQIGQNCSKWMLRLRLIQVSFLDNFSVN